MSSSLDKKRRKERERKRKGRERRRKGGRRGGITMPPYEYNHC
jgi:hypothetical protein